MMKMKTILLIIPAIVIVAVLAVIIIDSASLDNICNESGGIRKGDLCLVPIITNSIKTDSGINLSNIKTMKPNSAELFYYPDIPVQDRKDTYKLFMLIRLPEWMGGDADDISAYRVYSAKALDDACVVRYWPEYGRQRIENPCQGGMYRIIDGAMIAGLIPRSTLMTALPHLDLSADENGMLYVEPPKWTKTENGVIGYGREMTLGEFRENSEFLVDAFAESHPEYPHIPIEFAGYLLSDVYPEQYLVTASYTNYPDNSERILVTVGKVPGNVGFVYYSQENYEIWKVGDTTIRIEGAALDEHNKASGEYRTYVIKFKDEFYYRIEGRNIDTIKNEMMRVYFPEYNLDDMVLISKERK